MDLKGRNAIPVLSRLSRPAKSSISNNDVRSNVAARGFGSVRRFIPFPVGRRFSFRDKESSIPYGVWHSGSIWGQGLDRPLATAAEELPILKDTKRFREFVCGYSLLRQESKKDRERLRVWMTRNGRVGRLVRERDGSGVEVLLKEMKRAGFKCYCLFLSKIAAFTRPDVFIAYDSYAKDGLVELGIVNRHPTTM